MKQRLNLYDKGARAMKAVYGLSLATKDSTVEPAIFDLIFYRVSQINGCAYCLGADPAILREKGETAQRILLLNAWRETALYTPRERAALAWAEALTKISQGVPNALYAEVSELFTPQEIVDLSMRVISINAFNRINVSFRVSAGTHEAAFSSQS